MITRVAVCCFKTTVFEGQEALFFLYRKLLLTSTSGDYRKTVFRLRRVGLPMSPFVSPLCPLCLPCVGGTFVENFSALRAHSSIKKSIGKA